MSEAYSVQKPVAIWNSARGVWEKPETVNLLCEHLELYLETWQTSGMMRDGMVFELQMPVHPTSDSESLLLRTPKASEGMGGALGEALAIERGNHVGLRDQVNDLVAAQGQKVSRANLPTPTVADTFTDNLKSSQQKEGSMHSVNLSQAVHMNWGKFQDVVARWETIIHLPAPAPTKPDGKDGTHRLSSQFTEWMMGLRPGWVTGHGLSRKDELKACGNGVVPQQAELALRLLLEVDDV